MFCNIAKPLHCSGPWVILSTVSVCISVAVFFLKHGLELMKGNTTPQWLEFLSASNYHLIQHCNDCALWRHRRHCRSYAHVLRIYHQNAEQLFYLFILNMCKDTSLESFLCTKAACCGVGELYHSFASSQNVVGEGLLTWESHSTTLFHICTFGHNLMLFLSPCSLFII